jgi:hypothetical protein
MMKKVQQMNHGCEEMELIYIEEEEEKAKG